MAEIAVPDSDELIVTALNCEVPTQTNRTWSGRRKTVGVPGAERWLAEVEVTDIATEDEEAPWRAFALGLRGAQNWFRLVVACQYHVGGMPLVGPGAVAGYTLPLTGLLPATRVLKAGKYLTIPMPGGGYRLVCLTAPLDSDASGNATATFEPSLPYAPVEGAGVESYMPFLPALSSDTRPAISTRDGLTMLALQVEEAL